jgi:hypothetical protein
MHRSFIWLKLGRPELMKEDIIKMNLKEIGPNGVMWIYLVQDREEWRTVVKVVTKFWAPKHAKNP